ncbi:MAG: cytochrome b [Chloroflexota bacterium]
MSARFTYSFGLGGIAVFATLLTIVTGVLLTFYYVPSPAEAHASVVLIHDTVSFGAIVRGLHFWGAQLMVAAATLHLGRVVFTGGYRPPREVNWLVGVGLLIVTLLWDFSGFVLRWDDGAYWALLVGTNLVREVPIWGGTLYRILVGDSQLGANALLRFYGWHVVGLTVVGCLGVFYHLWRLRRDGGLSRPTPIVGEETAFITRDDLFFREAVAAALVTAFLVILAVLLPSPVGTAADPAAGVAGDVLAPWVFLWVQSLLRLGVAPLLAGILLPMLALGALVLVPYLDRRGPGRGVWFARERARPQLLVLALYLVIIIMSLLEAMR